MANVSKFAPEFWWQLLGGYVLRYCSISVQSRALLPVTCTTRFLSTCVDILVPIRGLVTDAAHRARVFASSACTAHPACCLGIGIMQIQAQSSHLFTELSTVTHVVRHLIRSIGCRPWSSKLLSFRNDCHSIFCHWLSFVTVFWVPSCSLR